jgi:hypothetical protein
MVDGGSESWMMDEVERKFWNAREEMEGVSVRVNKAVFALLHLPGGAKVGLLLTRGALLPEFL